jgi:hypothetical protein
MEKRKMKRKTILLTSALLLFLMMSDIGFRTIEVKAFDLGYHVDKCDKLGADFNLSPAAVKKIKLGDKGIDVASVLKPLYGKSTQEFLESMHFDNLPNYTKIKELWDQLTQGFQKLITDLAKANDIDGTLVAIGEFLHAIEDFYSHSNWVEYWLGRGIKPENLPTWHDAKAAKAGPYADGWAHLLTIGGNELYSGAFPTDRLPELRKINPNVRPHDPTGPNDPVDPNDPGLNKDNANRPNFDAAYALAVKDSEFWMGKIRDWLTQLKVWDKVRNYELGWLKELWYDLKEWVWDTAAKAAGHYKSGTPHPIILSPFPNASITLGYPEGCITGLPGTLPVYQYLVNNTGVEDIDTFNVTLPDGGLSYVLHVAAPDSWNANFIGDNCVVFNTAVAPITPGQTQIFSITANYSSVRNATLTLNNGAPLDAIGPGPLDEFDQEFMAIVNSFPSVALVTYTLTIETTTQGTTSPPTGNYSYTYGTAACVAANPNAGYILHHWELNGTNVGSMNPTRVTMDNDYTLRAVFTYSGQNTLTVKHTAGGMTSLATGFYTPGAVATVSATPDLNCIFEYWELDGAYAGSANPISMTMNTNHLLQAVFSGVWSLQWSQTYDGYGHAQFAQPCGDLDGDYDNEMVVGGYETLGNGIARILKYDNASGTYSEVYSWTEGGGTYNAPSGATMLDLDGDGNLELVMSWAYSGENDGVWAYKWDGTTLTKLDHFYCSFTFDVYTCDFDMDGNPEVVVANAPWGGYLAHVIGLGWNTTTSKFYVKAQWMLPSYSYMECPMVWSGNLKGDGNTEIVACISNSSTSTAGVWALSWNSTSNAWDAELVYSGLIGGGTPYGVVVDDMDRDGIAEIGIGNNAPGGVGAAAVLVKWNGTAYNKVWEGSWPSEYSVIEAVTIGDGDNDGKNEFYVGGEYVHVISWTGMGYAEKSMIIGTSGLLSGINIGDFNNDGLNEVKACDIGGYGPGKEWIFGYNAPIHDLGVTSITPEKTSVSQGLNATFYVTVKNYGNSEETFSLTLSYDPVRVIDTEIVFLSALTAETIAYTWNTTTGVSPGNYGITAYVHPLPGETDTGDNLLIDTFYVSIPGDINLDGRVDILDAIRLSNSFGKSLGQDGFNPSADINSDNYVNILDAIILANHFNQHT